jgi:hypothetical protein
MTSYYISPLLYLLPPAGLNGILDETLPFDAPVELCGASRDREFFAYIGGPAMMRAACFPPLFIEERR